jgi:serine/threonine protein kinase/Tfp pilus assembly protein PilF
MIGQQISHYKILKKLGEGGMGEVFLAQDTKLDRKVALKFLPPSLTRDTDAKERFKREAKAAAALNHPNIVTIYEINQHEDQTYIAMEHVEGQTLKEIITENSTLNIQNSKLTIEKIIDITTQICEGLAKAHEAGIVHRDIKPQNILINKEGRVKILDFGLAKLKGVGQLTKESSTLGTINYMSPEQALGKDVDHSTDIWSLGVILYEMLTGQLPFKGDYEQAVIYSIINENPEFPTGQREGLPSEFKNIIKKALAKDPSARYQSVNEMKVDLKKLKTESTPVSHIKSKGKIRRAQNYLIIGIIAAAIIVAGYSFFKGKNKISGTHLKKQSAKMTEAKWKNSIAVLPFSDMSPKKDQEYFCDGIAEEILNKLTRIDGLKVIARTSSFQFKEKQADITEIARKLDVSTILEGSVRKAGQTLRITAQLIDVKDQSHLWSDTFDREMKDILSIQDEIAFAIVNHLRGKLLQDEKRTIEKRYTENIQAHQEYLKGLFHLNKLTIQDMRKSLEYFNRAIEMDPDFALARCRLAHALNNLGYAGDMWDIERWKLIESEAQKAIKIDDTLSEAYMILADAQFLHHWNWAKSEHLFQRSIELNPGNADAHNWYAQYLSAMGRHEQAIQEIKKALELDPLSLAANLKHHMILINARLFQTAEKVLTECNNLFPGHPWLLMLTGYQKMIMKKYQEAVDLISRVPESSVGPIQKLALAQTMALTGNKGEALSILEKLLDDPKYRDLSETRIAKVYIALGDWDKTFEWLNRAYKNRDSNLVYLQVDSTYDRIRNNPRFTELVKKMRFPE